MTVQEMLIAIYEGIGEPSDLCPYTDINDPTTFDITTDGAKKLLGWVNRGYKRILNWKFPDGSQIRFDATRGSIYQLLDTVTYAVSSGSSGTITLASSLIADDFLNDVTFQVTDGTGEGQIGLIYDSTAAGVLSVYPALTAALDNTSKITVYPRNIQITDDDVQFKIAPSKFDNLNSILLIEDINNTIPLNKLGRTDNETAYLYTIGTPTAWYYDEHVIHFNANIDSSLLYKIVFSKLPADLSAATDTADIPSPWDEAIVLWCLWWGYKRSMETDAAYSTKKDLQEYMQTNKQQLETSFELVDGVLQLQM